MTVTIQKELADRITARPGTKDYGALSVWIQSQCDVQLVRVLPPTVFWPRPKVHSAMIRIVVRPDRARRSPIGSSFTPSCAALFLHRRKFLRGGLVGVCKAMGKPAIDGILAAQGLAADARAEQLDVGRLLALSDQFRPLVRPCDF